MALVCLCVCACMYALHLYVSVCVCMYVCMYVCMHVCVYMFAYCPCYFPESHLPRRGGRYKSFELYRSPLRPHLKLLQYSSYRRKIIRVSSQQHQPQIFRRPFKMCVQGPFRRRLPPPPPPPPPHFRRGLANYIAISARARAFAQRASTIRPALECGRSN